VARNQRGDPDLPPGPARDLVALFRRLRGRNPLTIGQLAVRTQLAAGHISEVLRGWKTPSPDAAAAIAHALGADERTALRARRLAEDLAELNRYNRAKERSRKPPEQGVTAVAGRAVVARLRGHEELLRRARILWVDDHPENNLPVAGLLRHFGASVDLPRSNAEAIGLMGAGRYDVVISDVARDDEGAGSELKGIELAELIFDRWGLRPILFVGRFNPATLPSASPAQRLELIQRIQRSTFAITNRVDEVLQYVLDMLERGDQES
jgi:CheY-like chemotaxis protein